LDGLGSAIYHDYGNFQYEIADQTRSRVANYGILADPNNSDTLKSGTLHAFQILQKYQAIGLDGNGRYITGAEGNLIFYSQGLVKLKSDLKNFMALLMTATHLLGGSFPSSSKRF
jgi:hypothetical protein